MFGFSLSPKNSFFDIFHFCLSCLYFLQITNVLVQISKFLIFILLDLASLFPESIAIALFMIILKIFLAEKHLLSGERSTHRNNSIEREKNKNVANKQTYHKARSFSVFIKMKISSSTYDFEYFHRL